MSTQNFIITNELYPGNLVIRCDFREEQKTSYMGQWVVFLSFASIGIELWNYFKNVD